MLGLVVEGGASRTAYSCGVMEALMEQNIRADYFIGVSAGIAFGVSYCSGQKDRNRKLINDYYVTSKYSGVHHMLDPHNKSFFNLDYDFSDIPNKHLFFDYKAFADYPGKCISVLTDLETGKAVYPDMPRDDKDFKHLRASCALPLLFPPIEIGGRKYMDGGIADSIPFHQALDEGCDKVIVILTRQRGYVKADEKAQRLILHAFREYPEFCELIKTRAERYNKQLEELTKLRNEGKVFVFYPKKELLVSRTEKDIAKLNRLYDYGYRHGMWAEDRLKEYLER